MLGIFLDSETNGLDPFVHHILEIAFKIINLSTGKEIYSYEEVIFQPKDIWEKSDLESLKINGLTYEMVLQGKEEKKIKEEIIDIFTLKLQSKSAVFICQNPSFDRIFFSKIISPQRQEELFWPYHWLDLASMYWALNIATTHNLSHSGFSKDQIAAKLHLPPEKKPHRAMNGVTHLVLCYKHLVGFPKSPKTPKISI